MSIVMLPGSQNTTTAIDALKNNTYSAERLLSSSGNYALLHGYQPSGDRSVIIERIGDLTVDQMEEAFKNHSLLTHIDHENIAPCIDIFSENGALYIVSAPGEGTLLEDYAVANQHDIAEIGIQLCNAVSYLDNHREFLFHVLVEPGAVIMTTHRRARIVRLSTLINVHGAPRGITWYNTRDEVYGIGATLDALTARLHAAVTSELRQVIDTAIDPDPTVRWPSAAELRYALLPIK